LLFAEITKQKEPIFVYNPHEWFAYSRKNTEESIIGIFKEKNRQILITVCNNYPLDQKLKYKFSNDYLQYHISNRIISDRKNYYFNIFSDYMIEVFIDENINNKIDKFYRETKIFNKEAEGKLLKIISYSGRNKLVISKNKRKAEKYKKTLAKSFYIKN
jgi:hypothetical protein